MNAINSDRVFIIAEAGINHGGNLDKACALADAAKESGADAVKFQTFREMEVGYPNITYNQTSYLKSYCESIDITFFSTPHSNSAADWLAYLKVPLMKISAPKVGDPLCEYILDKKIPTIVSINMDVLLHDVLNVVLNTTTTHMLHTVSEYPCYNPRLMRMDFWKQFTGVDDWGYSDHGEGYGFCVEAVKKYDANIIEKHFKIDKDCVDANVSIYPNAFKDMVREIREVEATKNKAHETD